MTAAQPSDRLLSRMMRGEICQGPYDLDQLCECLAIRNSELQAEPDRIQGVRQVLDSLKEHGLVGYIDTGRTRALPVSLPVAAGWRFRVGGGPETLEQEVRRKKREEREAVELSKGTGRRSEPILAISEQDLLKAKPYLTNKGFWPAEADQSLCIYSAAMSRRVLKLRLLGKHEEMQIVNPRGEVIKFDTLTENNKEFIDAARLQSNGAGKEGDWNEARARKWLNENGWTIERKDQIPIDVDTSPSGSFPPNRVWGNKCR